MKLFNLNVGIKLDNNKEVVDLILKDNYDIVTLQESMRKLDEGVFPQYDSCDFIRKNTSFKNNFFGAVWVARAHKKNNVVHRDFGGYVEQGNQLLSNYPIIKSSNVFYYKEYSNYEDSTNFRKEDHPRAFIECILDINGKELQVINVHGIWTSDKMGNDRTQNQIDTILNKARKDIPCIIVGDFNLLPTSKYIKMMSDNYKNLIDEYKIKSTRPEFNDGLDKGNLVCDYVFVNNKVKVNDFYVLKSNASDHLPLVLDFDL